LRIVLDASAALASVLGRNPASQLLDVLDRASIVLAPDLFSAEVANGLWKYVVAGEITVEEGGAALDAALNLVDRSISFADLGQEVLREAALHEHPAYDLCYAVAARREGAAVLTIDRRLGKLLSKMKIAVVELAR